MLNTSLDSALYLHIVYKYIVHCNRKTCILLCILYILDKAWLVQAPVHRVTQLSSGVSTNSLKPFAHYYHA